MDPRNRTLAEQIVSYSLDLQPGENVLIEAQGTQSRGLLREIAGASVERGANVFTNLLDDSILRRILLEASSEQISAMAKHDASRMKDMREAS